MKSLGQTAYEAYCEKTGWKSLVSGADLPQWDALTDGIREAWEASAGAVSKEIPRHDLDRRAIARVAYETTRAVLNPCYGESLDPWSELPVENQDQSEKSVQFYLERPNAGPEALHEFRVANLREDGWQWGRNHDEEKKESPTMVSFVEMPLQEQLVARIFLAIIRSLTK